MRKLPILLTLAVLLIGAHRASAIINFTTDTATELIGNFSFTGTESGTASPLASGFQELPGGFGLSGGRDWYLFEEEEEDDEEEGLSNSWSNLRFRTTSIGSPDDPSFTRGFVNFTGGFSDVSGVYNNGPNGFDVAFRIFNLYETDGSASDGTFSGDFEFKVRSASVPDGGMTIGLLGLALTGLAFVRRRIA